MNRLDFLKHYRQRSNVDLLGDQACVGDSVQSRTHKHFGTFPTNDSRRRRSQRGSATFCVTV